MTHTTRPGRPRKAPTSPLGALIARKMDARGISAQTLAARLAISRATLWRLMSGVEASSRRVTGESLCRALELTGVEQSAFMRECARYVTSPTFLAGDLPDRRTAGAAAHGADSSQLHTPEVGAEDTPRLRFGRFLRACLRAKGVSQSWLARQIKVAPSTISRLARGKLATTHRVEAEAICRALDLNAMDRRAFFALAAEAYLMPLAVRTALVQLRFRALEQRAGVSLEEVESEVVKLRARRNQGDVKVSYRRAKALFEAMFQSHTPITRLIRSPELARAKLLVGFEYCEAQAAYLNWYSRVPHMIATLNTMESEVIVYFPPSAFASERGHLLNLRGPLYYKRPDRYYTTDGLDETISELTHALIGIRTDAPSLWVELLRNRAHAYLLHDNVQAWQDDLQTARRVASGIQGHERERWQALVEYSWGEGYKRLANWRALQRDTRQRYVEKALHALLEGEAVFHRYHAWQGYELLARIAQAQCLILQDADEALRRVEALRAAAEGFYPSLLAKIDSATAAALRYRQSGFRL